MSFVKRINYYLLSIFSNHTYHKDVYDELPRPRLKRTIIVNDGEWLPLISVECEE